MLSRFKSLLSTSVYIDWEPVDCQMVDYHPAGSSSVCLSECKVREIRSVFMKKNTVLKGGTVQNWPSITEGVPAGVHTGKQTLQRLE